MDWLSFGFAVFGMFLWFLVVVSVLNRVSRLESRVDHLEEVARYLMLSRRESAPWDDLLGFKSVSLNKYHPEKPEKEAPVGEWKEADDGDV